MEEKMSVLKREVPYSKFQNDSPMQQYPTKVIKTPFGELGKAATLGCCISPIIWDGGRKAENFKEIHFVMLDMDDGCTVAECTTSLDKEGVAFIIVSTRHHQRLKGNKPACDRFRIILLLDEPICELKKLKSCYSQLLELFPTLDSSCFCGGRLFYPGSEILALSDGKAFAPRESEYKSNEKGFEDYRDPEDSKIILKGQLTLRSQRFFNEGDVPNDSNWHKESYIAVLDAKACGYALDEVGKLYTQATKNYLGYLDENDLKLLEDVYFNRTPEDMRYLEVDRAVSLPTKEDVLQALKKDRQFAKDCLESSIPFLDESFDDVIELERGMTLIGAQTGHGKSTICANIIAHYIYSTPERDKKILVISGEENTDTVLSKVACILSGVDWKEFRVGMCSENDYYKVEWEIQNLVNRVVIISKKFNSFKASCLEDVIVWLEKVKSSPLEWDLVIVDYLQSINESKSDRLKNAETWKITKAFGNYLNDYCEESQVPIVVFAQLKDAGLREKQGSFTAAPLAERVQGDRQFANHAPVVIEVYFNRDKKESLFLFHKDRWGNNNGKSWSMRLEKGKYVAAY